MPKKLSFVSLPPRRGMSKPVSGLMAVMPDGSPLIPETSIKDMVLPGTLAYRRLQEAGKIGVRCDEQ